MKKTDAIPEVMPLAALCVLLGEEERQIRRIMQKAGIEIPEKGMYPVAGTIRAVKDHYKSQTESVSSEERADRARKARNDADSSDIDLAEKRGLLMLKADAKGLWSDERIEMRRAIQDSKTIPEKVKAEVVKILQSVKLGEIQ